MPSGACRRVGEIGIALLLALPGAAQAQARDSVRARPDSAAAAPVSMPVAADSAAASPATGSGPAGDLVVRLRRTGGLDALSADPARPVDPAGIAFDSFGRVYVADRALRRLVRYDTDGRFAWEAGALGDEAGRLRRPGQVAPAGVLAMAVLDEENRRVLTYDLFGRFQAVRVDLDAALASSGDGVTRPVGLASDRGGTLYVADAERDRVLVFDPSGTLVRTIAGHGASAGALHGVAGIAVGRRGDVVVTERVGGRVQRLDPSGAPRASWALPRSPAGDRLPVAVDDSLRVAVAEPRSGALWLFDRSGRLVGSLEHLAEPSALAFARDGSLWVAERKAVRLSRYVLEPTGPRPPDKD